MRWSAIRQQLLKPRGVPAVLAVAVGVFLLGAAVREDGFFGSVTAAWIQALGSIGAIWASGHFLVRERHAEARAKLSALTGVVDVPLKLIEEAGAKLGQTGSYAYLNYLRFDFRSDAFDKSAVLLEAIVLHEVPSGDLAVGILNLREQLASTQKVITAARKYSVMYNGGPDIDLTAALSVASDVRAAFAEAWIAVGGE